MTTCPFCNRPVLDGECQRRHCGFRAEYLRRQSLLPPPPLDVDMSELPEPAKPKLEDDGYIVVCSQDRYRRGEVGGLSSWDGTKVSAATQVTGRGRNGEAV